MVGSPHPPSFNQPLRDALRSTSRKDQQQIDRIDRRSSQATTSLLSRLVTALVLCGALLGVLLLVVE